MPDSVNPYTPGQPIDNPDLFFGRRDVLGSVREHMVKGRRVFAIFGAPRLGKTSLLQQLPANLPEEIVAVRVALLEETPQQLDRLLWRLADAISRQVETCMAVQGLEPTWSQFEAQPEHLLEGFWPRVRSALQDRLLLLMLDDLDGLTQGDASLLQSFLTTLSTWRDQDEGLAMVLTMSPDLGEAVMRRHPRLFGGALTFVLGPLSSEEAIRLITWPVDGVLTYDYGVARRLIEVTSGHPHYLQLLCFEVFNRCAPSGWVNQRDVDLVIEDLVGREIADFRQIWDESTPREQAVLAALVSLRGARGVATAQEVRTILSKAGARVEQGQVADAMQDLVARGVLEKLGALSYRFRVALLRDWLCERIDLEQVGRDTRWASSDQRKTFDDQGVSKLRVSKDWRRVSPKPVREPGEAAEAGEEERPPSGRTWLWVAVAVVLGLIVVGVVGRALLWPSPAVPTLTATAPASPRARLATATQTSEPVATLLPKVGFSPSATPVPLPTATPTPTPPLVVARTVPSIAYLSRGPGDQRWAIYTMNSDGSNRLRLVDSQAEFLSAPSWSPDGSRIAIVSDWDGNPDIWVMSSDGSDPINLTQHEAKDHSPAWSPDGEWIAFASVRDSVYWELYVMRADGTDLQRLTWWEDASDLWPTWSPDGTRLAFASKRDGNWEIYAMDRDGSNLTRLTDHPADDTSPAWSPDGSRIAFESTREGYAEVFVMPAAGGEAVNVSSLPWATDLGPTWSPDGGRIAFYSDRDGEWDIFAMASDGSDVVKLTGDNSSDQVPAWRP